MEAYGVNGDQNFNDFNTAYSERYNYGIAIPRSSLDHDEYDVVAATNQDFKIAIPSPFINGSTSTLDQTGSTSGPVVNTLNGKVNQIATRQVLQVDQSTNNHRDPSRSLEEHSDHQPRWYQNKVLLNGIISEAIVCLFVVCWLVLFFVLVPRWVEQSENRVPYKLEKNDNYKVQMKTKEYGIEFYVQDYDKFNGKYHQGTPERAKIENTIIKEYLDVKERACSWEIWWRSGNVKYPTPACDTLQNKGLLFNTTSNVTNID